MRLHRPPAAGGTQPLKPAAQHLSLWSRVTPRLLHVVCGPFRGTRQSGDAVPEVWPIHPKIFTLGRFTGGVCQALNQVTFAFGTAVPLEFPAEPGGLGRAGLWRAPSQPAITAFLPRPHAHMWTLPPPPPQTVRPAPSLCSTKCRAWTTAQTSTCLMGTEPWEGLRQAPDADVVSLRGPCWSVERSPSSVDGAEPDGGIIFGSMYPSLRRGRRGSRARPLAPMSMGGPAAAMRGFRRTAGHLNSSRCGGLGIPLGTAPRPGPPVRVPLTL